MVKPLLQAHRGVSTDYPENTMSAFVGAYYQGYKIIELDPAVTKDGKIVVLHDAAINRTGRNADGSPIEKEIRISDITYGDTLKYDFGIYKSNKFKGEKLPLLSHALDFARSKDILIKIDNKIENFSEAELDLLFKIIKISGARVGITCKSVEFAIAAADKIPEAEIHFDGEITEDNLDKLFSSIKKERLVIWLNYHALCQKRLADECAVKETLRLIKQCARLGIWILSDENEYDRAVGLFEPDIIETTGSLKPQVRVGVLADTHTHSLHSHDSRCPIADMAQSERVKGISVMTVTDHCDIELHETLDVQAVVSGSIDDAAKTDGKVDGIEILRGIELGEAIYFPEVAKKIYENNPCDLVIGSVHAVRFEGYEMPYSMIDFSQFNEEILIAYLDKYFDDMLVMINTVPFDVLAHITCPLRYINGKYGFQIDCRRFEEKIINILKEINRRSIALEINTSCKGTAYDEFMPEEWIIKAYKDLGGSLVTLASDAHVAGNAAHYFSEALALLKKHGFKNIYYFKGRYLCQCAIK